MHFSEYANKSAKEVLEILKTNNSGLLEKEVLERQKIYGFNEIKVKEINFFNILIRQFKSPFFYLLFIGAIIAFFAGQIINGFLIIAFVLINVGLGFFQEAKAEKSIILLKKYVSAKVRVLREGKEKIIEQKFLIPGDIVLLEPGNIVPADLRIIKSQNFWVDEEILSGESIPLFKTADALSKETNEIFKAKNIIFAGTSAISGEAEGVVINVGKNTVFGKMARLGESAYRESAYEKNLLVFSRIVLRIVVSTIIIVFSLNLLIKGTADLLDFLIFCLALVISIIPEALPLVVTFSLSKGALKMAKKKVVVKRLVAVEGLGDIEILCTDKTGTLTENKLQLEEIFSPDREKCLLFGLLSSSFLKEEIESSKNPFDLALFQETSAKIKRELLKYLQISEIPFDVYRLRTSVLVEDKKGKKFLIAKGAPESILKISSKLAGKKNRKELEKEISQKGKEGKRILAIAFKEFKNKKYSPKNEKGMTFLGYFSFEDPLKNTAKQAVSISKKLGVQIKILTGDSFEVAGRVAKEINLIENPESEVILGEDLEALSNDDFKKSSEKFNVFARVSPETKHKIIKVLQEKFEVGFLGEGINDVPALKTANVAIAVESAADISKNISDIILLKKDLRVIVAGIREGRNIFSNINKYIKCTLASNFGNFYSIAAISLLLPFLPMMPVQILLVNL